MFLRQTRRQKDGKTHTYWSVVENQRLQNGRVVQRHVLYLGEISPSQAAAWRKSIEVFDEAAGHPRTLALFPEDRCAAVTPDSSVVQLRLSEMRLCRPRQWGACWLAGQVWEDLHLDRFWSERLPRNRKGTRWDQVLQVLVSYRLIAPGSEWKLHRDWFGRSAMADLLGSDFRLAMRHKLYTCHDFLLAHKADLFAHLTARWRDLFNAGFDVLLYDLTSTYFEINAADVPEGDKRRHGYSRDKRPDCPQVVIALVVTPDGLPLAYEVLPGNTADCKTLRTFLDKIEQQYGRARRVWARLAKVPTAKPLECQTRGWIAASPLKRCWPRCEPAIRRCNTWWGPRKAVSHAWRSLCWPSPGLRRVPACRSNCWPMTANFTSTPKVSIASARNARCASGR